MIRAELAAVALEPDARVEFLLSLEHISPHGRGDLLPVQLTEPEIGYGLSEDGLQNEFGWAAGLCWQLTF